MAIQVASFLIPKNGNLWYVLDDKYIKGGLHVVPTDQDRDDILDTNRKQSMLVIVQETGKIWSLQEDMLTWKEFQVGSKAAFRQTVIRTITGLQSEDVADFQLSLGGTALIYHLEVSTACQVEAFEKSDRKDTNPYRFVATEDHKIDDGSTLMSDGTILRGRRYTILSNQDDNPNSVIYFRITNTDKKADKDDTSAKDITLTISFLPIEANFQPDPSLNT